MKFNELPVKVQEKLTQERAEAHITWKRNDAYNVRFTNKEGTRCFEATREQTVNAPYGIVLSSSSVWVVSHYSINVKVLGGLCPQYILSVGQKFNKSFNGTEIPQYVSTKAEVLKIAKSIGTLEM